jgi:hypothetical protein
MALSVLISAWLALYVLDGEGRVLTAPDWLNGTCYPMVIKLALPPAAVVLTLIERSVTSHSSE